MEKSNEQQRFSEIIIKHLDGVPLTSDEKIELLNIAKSNNFKVEKKEIDVKGITKKEDCYWICRGSNWSCNPDHPAPGCECIKICI